MTERKYTDDEEWMALKLGASALKLRAELLTGHASDDHPEIGRIVTRLRTAADVLDEMADTYAEPLVRDPESWQAVAREGRRFA